MKLFLVSFKQRHCSALHTGAGFLWGSSLEMLVLALAPASQYLAVFWVASPATGVAGEEGHSFNLSHIVPLHGSKLLRVGLGKDFCTWGGVQQ